MARNRQISDDDILAAVLQTLLHEGEKSVTFAAISKQVGLAPSTLVQRYLSCPAMITAALNFGWDRLESSTTAALSQAQGSGKGTQAVLKAISAATNIPALLAASLRYPHFAARAATWREIVEQALTARSAGNPKARETAALIFAAWQGRMLWDAAGGKGFRLGEALKRLV